MTRNEEARVPDELLDFDEDQIFYYQGKPFTGISYSDRPVRAEIHYVDGLQNGLAQEWYPSGVLMSETAYSNDVKHGIERECNEDGSVRIERFYENGLMIRETVE